MMIFRLLNSGGFH